MATRTVGGVPEADPVHRPGPAPAPVYDDSLPPSQERARRNYGDLPGPRRRGSSRPRVPRPGGPPPDGAVPDHAAASPVGAGAPAPAAPAPAPAARARRPLTNRSPWGRSCGRCCSSSWSSPWPSGPGGRPRGGSARSPGGRHGRHAGPGVGRGRGVHLGRGGTVRQRRAGTGGDRHRPPFGQRVPRGSRVAVLVSLGRPTVPTPGAGDTLSAYQSRLRDRTLQWTVADEVYSDSVPAASSRRSPRRPARSSPQGRR